MAKSLIGILSALIVAVVSFQPVMAYQVGLDPKTIDRIYSPQFKTEWCWATSIHMLLAYYGYFVQEQEIVERFYGQPVNEPGTLPMMSAALNGHYYDDTGRTFTIKSAAISNAYAARYLVSELTAKRPVILCTQSHAVLCTGCEYYLDSFQNPCISAIVVRDP